MKAGPGLDALVAEKVMGLVCDHNAEWPDGKVEPCWSKGEDGPCVELPLYSTDIAAAWEIVEKIGQGWRIARNPEGWAVEVESGVLYSASGLFGAVEHREIGSANTAPLAICLAALKAVAQKDDYDYQLSRGD